MHFVFVDQDIDLNVLNGREIIAPLLEIGTVTCFDDAPCSQDTLYERAKDADVIFVSVNRFDNELIDKLQKLKIAQFMGIGYSNYFDVEYCEKKGIKVLGVGEYGSNAVAEYTLALMLDAIRGISRSDGKMKKAIWSMDGVLGGEISGATVGIIGTGAIGSLVARKTAALGATVLGVDIYPNKFLAEEGIVNYVDIETLMQKSDIVSVHLKYTQETKGYVSADLLSLMKPSSVFINTARAQVVDYDALQRMLENRKIRCAALDVHYEEPLSDWGLAQMENVIATPHLAYFTESANTNLLKKSVESVLQNLPENY
ncbi:D-isomer specific 2-hydroxyacid dehydrogenase family protein [Synergistaceae bacterium OttesenSCG-928-D05]|nr:D-isomer specific 2-hydroxyacid dehydrogenase family protein [Synergistaceae bacterium OttesenSCG-928-D05]